MNRQRLAIAVAVAVIGVLLLVSQTFYVVDQRQQAIVLRLGQPVRVANAPNGDGPGLKLKVPFLENVVKFDNRNQAFETREEEIIAANQERLVVDAFVRYRIYNPLSFYRALRDQQTAEDRLERLVISSLRQVLGTASSDEIVSSRRSELTRLIRDDMARRVGASRMGVQIIDVRIKRADLPAGNQAAVFERMKSARQQEAAQIRAIGEQQRREIIATATREAEETRGQGDAERARIFASSFGRDPSFASFYRSMQAYEASMGQGDTTMVLSPDSDFFKYFDKGSAGR